MKYWSAAWQALTLSRLREIVEAGFDGVYLDIVDGFQFFEHDREHDTWIDDRENPETGNTYRHDMASWVIRIAETARALHEDFLVVPQNGAELLSRPEYRGAINAIGVEDLYTLDERRQDEAHTRAVSEALAPMRAFGKPVFVIEYCTEPALRSFALLQALADGFGLLLTDRELEGLGFSAPVPAISPD